jgi:hypothetical protein
MVFWHWAYFVPYCPLSFKLLFSLNSCFILSKYKFSNKAHVAIILSHTKMAWIHTRSNPWRYPMSNTPRRLILLINYLDCTILSPPNFHLSEFSAPTKPWLIFRSWDRFLCTLVFEIPLFLAISRTVSHWSLSIKSGMSSLFIAQQSQKDGEPIFLQACMSSHKLSLLSENLLCRLNTN